MTSNIGAKDNGSKVEAKGHKDEKQQVKISTKA